MEVYDDASQGTYVYIRNKTTGEEQKYKYTKGYAMVDDIVDFDKEASSGFVIANLIQIGEYEVYRVGMRARSAHLDFSSDWEGSDLFTATKEGAYLGSYAFTGVAGNYLIGTFKGNHYANLNKAENISIESISEIERDLKIGYEKYEFVKDHIDKIR